MGPSGELCAEWGSRRCMNGPRLGSPGLLEEAGCISCCGVMGCPSSVQTLAAGDEAKEGKTPAASEAGEAPRPPSPRPPP